MKMITIDGIRGNVRLVRSRFARLSGGTGRITRYRLIHRVLAGLGPAQTLVEFALLLPVFLLLVLGTLDLGRAVATYNLAGEAARAGARAGRIQSNDSAVSAAVLYELGPLAPAPKEIKSDFCPGDSDCTASVGNEPYVKVVVKITFDPVVGLMLGFGSFDMTASSQQYLNSAVAAGDGTPVPAFTVGPTPNATERAGATVTAQIEATKTAVASGSVTVLAGLTFNGKESDQVNPSIQCLTSGRVTSSIGWTSNGNGNPTVYFLLVKMTDPNPTNAQIEAGNQSGTNYNYNLDQAVVGGVDYDLWVYNSTTGAKAILKQFTMTCSP